MLKELVHNGLCMLWQGAAVKNDQLFRGNADFSSWMTQEEAGFVEGKGNQYQPSTDALIKVLKRFPISEKDAIIDVGCGKGKAMYLMERFPFRKWKPLRIFLMNSEAWKAFLWQARLRIR